MRMCINFTNLNKACPKDPFPLQCIDQIVDSTAGCDLLCFLDSFSGYHLIKMAVEDEEKMVFITPIGCFCYTCMPFGLKNAGATFQGAMQKCLGSQIRRNIEAYIDDIVMKIWSKKMLIDDLRETFANLRKVQLKLNPEKCTFGVPSEKFLRYLVSHRGIEANPDKIKAIDEIQAAWRIKDIQCLNGCITMLGRFSPRLGERALPFFKLLKKPGPMQWTLEAEAALQDLKEYLALPPILVATKPNEPLLLYVAATPQVVSAVLVVEWEEDPKVAEPGARGCSEQSGPAMPPPEEADQSTMQGQGAAPVKRCLVQRPVYFISTMLRDARLRYSKCKSCSWASCLLRAS
jgi:hypothetical protein